MTIKELYEVYNYTSDEDKVYIRINGKLYTPKDINIENSDVIIDV